MSGNADQGGRKPSLPAHTGCIVNDPCEACDLLHADREVQRRVIEECDSEDLARAVRMLVGIEPSLLTRQGWQRTERLARLVRGLLR